MPRIVEIRYPGTTFMRWKDADREDDMAWSNVRLWKWGPWLR